MQTKNTIQDRVIQLKVSMSIGHAAYAALREAGVSEAEIPRRASVLVAQVDAIETDPSLRNAHKADPDAMLRQALGNGKIEGDTVTLIFKGNRAVSVSKSEWAALCKSHVDPRSIVAKRLK